MNSDSGIEFPTEFDFRVRYSETDQMGSYYNSRALEWFEVGRSELSRTMGLPYSKWEEKGIFLPLIECSVKFKGRARYDDQLTMAVGAEKVGRTRIKFHNRVWQKVSKAPVCEGFTIHALINKEGRPVRIPEWVEVLFKG